MAVLDQINCSAAPRLVQSPSDEGRGDVGSVTLGPQHFLNFVPEPHGQGSLRPGLAPMIRSVLSPAPGRARRARQNSSMAMTQTGMVSVASRMKSGATADRSRGSASPHWSLHSRIIGSSNRALRSDRAGGLPGVRTQGHGQREAFGSAGGDQVAVRTGPQDWLKASVGDLAEYLVVAARDATEHGLGLFAVVECPTLPRPTPAAATRWG